MATGGISVSRGGLWKTISICYSYNLNIFAQDADGHVKKIDVNKAEVYASGQLNGIICSPAQPPPPSFSFVFAVAYKYCPPLFTRISSPFRHRSALQKLFFVQSMLWGW